MFAQVYIGKGVKKPKHIWKISRYIIVQYKTDLESLLPPHTKILNCVDSNVFRLISPTSSISYPRFSYPPFQYLSFSQPPSPYIIIHLIHLISRPTSILLSLLRTRIIYNLDCRGVHDVHGDPCVGRFEPPPNLVPQVVCISKNQERNSTREDFVLCSNSLKTSEISWFCWKLVCGEKEVYSYDESSRTNTWASLNPPPR